MSAHHTPYPATTAGQSRAELRPKHPRYFAHEDLLAAAESVVAGYNRSVTGGTPVSLTHSWRDPDLPDESVQITVGDEHLLLTVDEWLNRTELAEPYVMAWVSSRVRLEGAQAVRGRGRAEPTWHDAIRRANPGRR
ncbi:hypothetical protein V1260_15080 [Brachybacterium sp. J144]|uniref:hypothetical protein n=1 Tax=Brachybacterium sp. J144 TaxID=3116487 RepID=UPI002E75B9B2|nr:hypothetical protein [Brachybacterium sp. J144]MEE1652103.1 hypothetical protein [Brachybacterium sp. J144]